MTQLRLRTLAIALIGAGSLLPLVAAAAPPTPAQRCEAEIELAAAKFAQCRLNAESKDSKAPDPAKRSAALAKCSDKLARAFLLANAKYGAASCTTTTASEMDAYLTQCAEDATSGAGGEALPDYPGTIAACEAELEEAQACGDGVVGGDEECDGDDLAGATCSTQGFEYGALRCGSGCALDTSACFSWSERWVEHGDGTATDRVSGLRWELKTEDGSLHDWRCISVPAATFTWTATEDGTAPNGTLFTAFLAALNQGTAEHAHLPAVGCFAGFCDWRLPTSAELEAAIGMPGFVPLFPAWSVTTTASAPTKAWAAGPYQFNPGQPALVEKHIGLCARALRGGS